MNTIENLWNINCEERTKYMIILALIVCSFLMCFCLGPKKHEKTKQITDK